MKFKHKPAAIKNTQQLATSELASFKPLHGISPAMWSTAVAVSATTLMNFSGSKQTDRTISSFNSRAHAGNQMKLLHCSL